MGRYGEVMKIQVRFDYDLRAWGIGIYLSVWDMVDRIVGDRFMFLLHVGCFVFSISGKEVEG